MEGNLLQQLSNCYATSFDYLWGLFFRHSLMSVCGVLSTASVGTSLGILLARYTGLSRFVVTVTDIVRTVPVITMLVILMLVMGLGSETVVLIMFLYTSLPVIKDTYIGIASVDANIKGAGKDMGMTRNQVLRTAELPLSVPVIIGGIHIALAVTIGVVAAGSFIGAPTFGNIVIRGINATGDTTFILAGATPITIVAIVIDVLLRFLERRLDPTTRHRRNRSSHRPQSINM